MLRASYWPRLEQYVFPRTAAHAGRRKIVHHPVRQRHPVCMGLLANVLSVYVKAGVGGWVNRTQPNPTQPNHWERGVGDFNGGRDIHGREIVGEDSNTLPYFQASADAAAAFCKISIDLKTKRSRSRGKKKKKKKTPKP